MHDRSSELPPHPISEEEYHDYRLIGLLLNQREVELTLESPTNIRTMITLKGVERLMAFDVLESNLIDCIDCHRITADNVELVLAEFSASNSAYFSEKAADDVKASGSIIDKLFVAIRPAYGASLIAITADLTEATLDAGR